MVVKAREIMHSDVMTVDPATTALACARQMVAARKGYAVLLKEGRMQGIVTEWDFLAKVVARMAQEGIRRMVVTQGGRVVGMITSRDVIKAFKPYVDKISADISRLQPSLT